MEWPCRGGPPVLHATDASIALAAATDRLLYTSEGDSPLTPCRSGALPSAADSAALVGTVVPTVEAETADFGALFDRLTMPADTLPATVATAKKWAKVYGQFYGSSVALYCIRDTAVNAASWKVYIVGMNAFGLSGLVTTSIET